MIETAIPHATVEFRKLALGTRFHYVNLPNLILVKLENEPDGAGLCAEWDAEHIADTWSGQRMYSFFPDECSPLGHVVVVG